MSATVTRRLSARRGSTTAPDPYAKNAHLNRESSSILTIVKVASPPVVAPSLPTGPPERPPSPRRVHRRIGSNPSSPLPSPTSQDPPPGRLSFAFSSFGAPHHQQQSNPSGPGGSPRIRPASPHRTGSGSGSAFSKQRLSPEQLLEVAKQATNPRYSPAVTTPSVASNSPVIHPRSSSPQQLSSSTVAPATFTPLPPDVYLPFLDRPAEVKALLSSPPSAKLFALLAQTFPKNVPPRESDDLPLNTADWTFADLSHWLNETTRDEASDSFWVQTARRCILKHSELIWERLKGALGVPPELDVEYTEAEYHDVFESSDEESDGVRADSSGDRRSASSSPSAPRPAAVTRTSSTPTILTQLPTPLHDETYFTYSPHELSDSVSGVIIEPVIAESPFSPNPPPLSLPASLSGDAVGLGDIGEEDEDEDRPTPPGETPPSAEEAAPAPEVHGLRISTPGTPMLPHLHSPSIRSATTGAPMRSPSFSARDSRPHSPTFVRSNSNSSLHRSGSFGSVRSLSSLDREARDREGPYDPVADRAPGNPIFPSNFARLAVGPTLAANNPALRSPTLPPQSKYGMRRNSSTRSIDRGNRFRRSWGHGDEYAVTFASGSSAAGSVRDEA
ncbi:hypothetical protein DFH08DRAFT_757678 [Mycena albidolilacea]|uniref:Uncharacterized protein n=1 Tax=Mycena albidolilacea TaxID=1033008 RepID=A0AAD7EB56_9AGAR|nr:hypothetical protein DFH08DRAFT_757678 [Mycena albidolilacea]